MLFRQAGIRHTDYAADRALFPIAADRAMVAALLAFALVAPFAISSLALSSYLTPWLVWTAATLGLNLVLGWAGQFHFGYAAIMGIGAYATVHAARHGVPWEIAVVLGGLTATRASSPGSTRQPSPTRAGCACSARRCDRRLVSTMWRSAGASRSRGSC